MPEHTPAPTPHRAIYGFSLYILFTALFFIYVLWALLPVQFGFHSYLPDRYFAVFVPILVMVLLFFFVTLIYPAINLSITANIDDVSTVVDPKHVLGEEPFTSWAQLKNTAKPQVTYQKKTSEYCTLCEEIHEPSEYKQIAPLGFMDLDEINKDLYN